MDGASSPPPPHTHTQHATPTWGLVAALLVHMLATNTTVGMALTTLAGVP